jgi:hypothetical protein
MREVILTDNFDESMSRIGREIFRLKRRGKIVESFYIHPEFFELMARNNPYMMIDPKQTQYTIFGRNIELDLDLLPLTALIKCQ